MTQPPRKQPLRLSPPERPLDPPLLLPPGLAEGPEGPEGPLGPGLPPRDPALPPVEPELPPEEPDVPPEEPDVPPDEPDVPPLEPELPPAEPDVPPLDPELPPAGLAPPPVEPALPPLDPALPPVDPPPLPPVFIAAAFVTSNARWARPAQPRMAMKIAAVEEAFRRELIMARLDCEYPCSMPILEKTALFQCTAER